MEGYIPTLRWFHRATDWIMTGTTLQTSIREDGFRLAMETIDECGMVLLELDGAIASWNAGAQEITQLTARDAVGRNFSTTSGIANRRLKLSVFWKRASSRPATSVTISPANAGCN